MLFSFPSPINPSVHHKLFICPSNLAEYHLTQRLSKHSARKAGEATMISAKKLAQMARKWQRMATLARKRLTSEPAKETDGSCGTSTSVAGKGHCVVYSADGRRFEVPLAYLGTAVFGELLRMSQDEFGFVSDGGRITLPCDATVIEYVMCLLRREASEEVVAAFLNSMVRPCHHTVISGLAPSMALNQQSAVCV